MTLLLTVAMLLAGPTARVALTQTSLTEADGLRIVMLATGSEIARRSKPSVHLTSIDTVVISAKQLGLPIRAVDSESASVFDYTLRIMRSEDGRHFQVGLSPVKGCGTAWFASDGVVYVGRAVAGCQR